MKYRKIFMVFVLLLWSVVGITMIFQFNPKDEMQVAEVFGQLNCRQLRGKYNAKGQLKGDYFTSNDQEEILINIAKEIGITKNYEIVRENTENSRIVSLNKEGENANVKIQIYTFEDEVEDNVFSPRQYINLDLSLSNYVDEIIILKNQIEEVLEKTQFECSGNLQFEAQFNGELSLAQKNRLSDDFLDKINAKSVTGKKDNEMYTIYAYSALIPDYEVVDDDIVNVNLVFNYDEINNITNFYMATPYILEEF